MYLILKSVLLQAHILVSSQGACSQAIMNAGGPEMKQKSVNPNTGEFLVTFGFKLPCKRVIHTSCSKWNGGKGETVSV